MMIWLLLICSFLVGSQGAVVSYIDSPACATSQGGCNFTDNIWNTTQPFTPYDQLIISSNQSITLLLSSSSVYVWSLSFGLDGANVTIVMYNASINLGSNSTDTYGLLWGADSSLIATHSVIGARNISGGSLSLNFTMLASAHTVINNFFSIDSQVFCQDTEFAYISLTTTKFTATTMEVENLNALGGSIQVNSMLVKSFGVVDTTSLVFPKQIVLANSSIFNIYNTYLSLPHLLMGNGTSLNFNTNDASLTFEVDYFDGLSTGAIYIGDDVQATVGSGYIPTLSIGEGVTVTIGSPYQPTYTGNIIQPNAVQSTNLVLNYGSTVYFPQYQLLNTQIMINEGGELVINENLTLSTNSSISGKGQVTIVGQINCPGTFNVTTAQFYGGQLITPNVTVIKIIVLTNGTIFGSVSLDDPLNVQLEANSTLLVNGDYLQSGGTISITVQDPNQANLQVRDHVTLNNVFFDVALPNSTSEKEWKLVTSTSASILKEGNTWVDQKYNLILKHNTLYLRLAGHTSFFTQYRFILIPVIVFAAVLLLVVIIVTLKRRKHHHHYKPIQH